MLLQPDSSKINNLAGAFSHEDVSALGSDAPGRIIMTHWPPPDGAISWQGIGQVADRVIARIVPTTIDEAA